jgi:hypothetical protein
MCHWQDSLQRHQLHPQLTPFQQQGQRLPSRHGFVWLHSPDLLMDLAIVVRQAAGNSSGVEQVAGYGRTVLQETTTQVDS